MLWRRKKAVVLLEQRFVLNIKQVMCEVIKIIHRVRATRGIKRFRFKMLHVARPEPYRSIRAWVHGGHSPLMKRVNVEIYPLAVPYVTQTWLACHQQLVFARLISTFHVQLKPWSHMSLLRCLVSYTQVKSCQIIIHEEKFNKLKKNISPLILRSL